MSTSSPPLKFAIFGTGFWARYQLSGWTEIPGVECVAVYNRTKAKASALAEEFSIPAVYDDPDELLQHERIDFVDIITNVETHADLTKRAADRGLPVICQKPMAPDLATARGMAEHCRKQNVPLLINENWRWQAPLREFKRQLDSGVLGRVWRATVIYNCSFPVFENQPFLKELDQFILTDIGTHILDVVRFLFGEARSIHAHTHQVHRDIRGEDAATVMLGMASGTTVVAEMSYASRWSRERFPQTFVVIEGEDASLELDCDFQIKLTTRDGTQISRHPPPFFPWADARYDVVHSSIVACQENLLSALNGTGTAETTAADNLKTLELVYAAYDSAASGQVIKLE